MKKFIFPLIAGFVVGLIFFLGPLSYTGKFIVLGADYLPTYLLDNVFVVGLFYAFFFGFLLTIVNMGKSKFQKKDITASSLFIFFVLYSFSVYLSFAIVLFFVLAYSFSHFGNIIFG